MATQARVLFDKISTAPDRLAEIRHLINSKTPETEYLEFKGGRIEEKEAKRYWSQALSGFANSAGGVLIFGVKTDRINPPEGGRRIDVAVDADPVERPTQLAQLLKDVLLTATADVVQGVEYLTVTDRDGKGFLVCFVPEGRNKPYRASLDPSQNYFQRVGDNFVFLSHPLLRSLFYPRTSARFIMTISARSSKDTVERQYCPLNVTIKNVGTASARDVVIHASFNATPLLEPFALTGTLWRIPPIDQAKETLLKKLAEPLHPGASTDALSVSLKADVPPNLRLWMTVYAADQEAAHFEHQFDFGQFEFGITDQMVFLSNSD